MTAPALTHTAEPEVVDRVDVNLRHERGYRFRADFDHEQYPPLWFDEPPPLGKDTAASPARVLAAAIGDCLAASLLFSLRKAGCDVDALDGHVQVELVRNEDRRLRIGRVRVTLDPKLAARHRDALERAIATFEDFCTVTQSVREGLDVQVEVRR